IDRKKGRSSVAISLWPVGVRFFGICDQFFNARRRNSVMRLGRLLMLAASVSSVGLLAAGNAAAQSADAILQKFQGDGPFQVRVDRNAIDTCTLFIPQARNNEKFNVIGWGNGTTATPQTYNGLLTSMASFGFIVAAANTSNPGTGREVTNCV